MKSITITTKHENITDANLKWWLDAILLNDSQKEEIKSSGELTVVSVEPNGVGLSTTKYLIKNQ